MKNTTNKTRLTPHFTLEEMTRSGAAVRHNINNEASEQVVKNLTALCINVLEPLREHFGAIRITSGYRSKELNTIVHGATNSQHMLGEAADIHIASMEVGMKMFEFIRQNLPFDQLLFEHRMANGCCWLHVSYNSTANRHHSILDYKA